MLGYHNNIKNDIKVNTSRQTDQGLDLCLNVLNTFLFSIKVNSKLHYRQIDTNY